LPPSLWFLLF